MSQRVLRPDAVGLPPGLYPQAASPLLGYRTAPWRRSGGEHGGSGEVRGPTLTGGVCGGGGGVFF